MTPEEADSLVSLVRSHAWVPLLGIVIQLAIRLTKSDEAVQWFPVNLRPKVRPIAALVLGIAGGAVAALARGGDWASAIVGGLVAGMMAISSHQVVIESMRQGRDLWVPKPTTIPPPAN